jgi:hypothetical protein
MRRARFPGIFTDSLAVVVCGLKKEIGHKGPRALDGMRACRFNTATFGGARVERANSGWGKEALLLLPSSR